MPKGRNNKFSQTRIAGSLMQPLLLRKIYQSNLGGLNLSQIKHSICV